MIDFDGVFAIIQTETVKTIQTQAETCNRRDEDVGRGAAFPHHEAAEPAAHRDGAGICEALDASESTIRRDLNELDRMGKVNKVHGGATLPDSQFLADEPTMAAKEALAVVQKSASQRRRRPSSPQRISSFWTLEAPRWRWSGS